MDFEDKSIFQAEIANHYGLSLKSGAIVFSRSEEWLKNKSNREGVLHIVELESGANSLSDVNDMYNLGIPNSILEESKRAISKSPGQKYFEDLPPFLREKVCTNRCLVWSELNSEQKETCEKAANNNGYK